MAWTVKWMGADFMNRRGLNCGWCGFPKDTPKRAHEFIHQQGEALIAYREEISRLRAIIDGAGTGNA